MRRACNGPDSGPSVLLVLSIALPMVRPESFGSALFTCLGSGTEWCPILVGAFFLVAIAAISL